MFTGYVPGHRRSYFVQDLKGGPARAFGPEGVVFDDHTAQPVVLSPDGKSVALVTADGEILLQPIDGTAARTIPQQKKADLVPVRWCPGGSSLMVEKQSGTSMEVYAIDIATGKQTLLKAITAPVGSIGVSGVSSVRIAPDCQSAVWDVGTEESRLFVVKGVR